VAGTHSKFTVVKVTSASGVLTDVSAYCTSAELSDEIGEIEAYGFGAAAKEYVTDYPDASFSIEGIDDPVVDTLLTDIKDALHAGTIASVAIEYGPFGSVTGKIKKTFNAVLTSHSGPRDIGDVGQFSAEFRVSGAVARTTY
jgi:hypothetical protein